MGQLELLVASGRKSNDIQSNSDLNINTQKNQIMKLASRSYSVLALMVVVVSVLFEVTVANPLPQSEDDYGDFDVSKLDRQAKLEDDTADADLVEGADPIGDIFGDSKRSRCPTHRGNKNCH